jgi:Tfp pilus assembly protein PilO
MTPLLRRIIVEKRALIVPLLVGLAANGLAYFLVVRPLEVKSAGAADRARQSGIALAAAEKDVALARSLVSGKSEADQELSAFYEKVLPADVTAARRVTYASLPELAKKTGVRYDARTTSVEPDPNTKLRRMTIKMVLQGEYRNIRQFIYALETAPEFIIIDDLTISERLANDPQRLTIDLSTYFRDTGTAHGP